MWRKEKTLKAAGRNINYTTTIENSIDIPKKSLKKEEKRERSNSIYTKNQWNQHLIDIFTFVYMAVLFTTAKI